MSFAFVGDLISDTNNASAATWTTTATLATALAAGQLGLVEIGTDNSIAADVASLSHKLTDSVGNQWFKVREFTNGAAGANAGATLSKWWCVATTTLPTNGSFTISLANGAVTPKTITGSVFSLSVGDFIRLESLTSLVNNAADVGSRTISSLANIEHMFWRGIAAERSVTTFTPTASYTALPSVGVGSGATGINVCGEWRILTGTTDTSDPTTTAVDQVSVYSALKELRTRDICYPGRKVLSEILGGGTSANTSSWTPVANRIYLFAVLSDAASSIAPTLTGNGLTYTQQSSQVNGGFRLTIVSATGASPTTGATNISFGAQTQSRINVLCVEMRNCAGVVQAATSATATATLAAFAKATNAAMSFGFAQGTGSTFGFGPEAGWQQVDEILQTGATSYGLMAFWRPDNGDLSAGSSTATIMAALEMDFVREPMTGDVGTFTLSGQVAGLRAARKIAAAAGSFSLSGQAAILSGGRTLAAGLGAFTLGGQGAALRRSAMLDADAGAFALSGQDAGLDVIVPAPVPHRALFIPALAAQTFLDITAYTKRWFRNGITPSATAARRLADGINQGMAQRQRTLFAHPNTAALHADFDSGTASDITTWRFACHTGPVTRSLRIRMVFLPLPQSATPVGAPYAQWTMTTGLTGAGTSTTLDRMTTPTLSTTADITARELFAIEQEVAVAPDTSYRFELHQVENCRPVSGTVYEVPRSILYTDQDACIDSTTIYQGGPITQQTIEQMLARAEDLWRLGQPLGMWTVDQPGDARTRTTATARNLFDQTFAAPAATSPGWPVSVPYSGTLDSSDVPVVFWAYASAVGGAGTLTLRDQADNVIATLAPGGAADWLATTGVLQDIRGTDPTTKLDLFLEGDGTNAARVFAAGCYMHSEAA